jgi:uncharacterized YigZ family protein
MLDEYKTLAISSKGIYKEKGSKFIAFAYSVFTEDEFKDKLQQLKQDYNDARHHCYAYRLGADMQQYRFSDDGEPSSTAGKPIYGQIQSFELTNIAIIVIRYFGGTKLGVGGLITAYRAAAKNAIEKSKIITRTVDNFYEIQFEYVIMSDVMNFIKKNELDLISQSLEEKGVIQFRIRQCEAEVLLEKFEKIKGIKIDFKKTL